MGFAPSHYDPPTPSQAYDFGLGCNVMLATFISMYMLELAFDANMRFGLTLHHWVSILLTLWAIPTIYYNGDSVYTIRAMFVLSLYMSTEQNVFVEMLCYQLQMFFLPTALLHLSLVLRPVTPLNHGCEHVDVVGHASGCDPEGA